MKVPAFVALLTPEVLEGLRPLLRFEEQAAELQVDGWDHALDYFLVEYANRAVADGRWPRWTLDDIEDVESPSARVAAIVRELIEAHARGRLTFRGAVAELLSRMLELERVNSTTH